VPKNRLEGGRSSSDSQPLAPGAAPLDQLARDYRQSARVLLPALCPALEDVEADLQLQAQLGTGSPKMTAEQIRDALEVVEWYVFFIEAKLRRAAASQAEEGELSDHAGLSDADGSAKVALIAIDRSTAAWSTLRAHLARHSDAILDLLVRLEQVRRLTEAEFPRARTFRRPGLD
jgi:hypothetical protein